jgi:hypothetical protein
MRQQSDKIQTAPERTAFIWKIHEKDIDYTLLHPSQIINHFDGITSLTTKNGFTDLVRDMHWQCENCHGIVPRYVTIRRSLNSPPLQSHYTW